MAIFLVSSLLILFVTSSWAQTTSVPFGATTNPPHTHRTKPPGPDVVSVLNSTGTFNTLIDLVTKAGLVDTLLAAQELTVFAPTDDAFARLPASTLGAIGSDPNLLASTLKYHVVPESYQFRGHFQDTTLDSLEGGKPIRLNVYGNLHTISAEGVNVTTRNLRTANGYVHALDGVMVPPAGNIVDLVDTKPNLQQIKTILASNGLRDVIEKDMNITVFLPNDDAFAKLDPKILTYLQAHPMDLQNVVLYHVVSSMTLYSIGMRHTLTFPTSDKHHDRIMTLEDNSDNIYVNDAKLVERDISAINGVIHVIDKVLIPARVLLNIESQGLQVIG